jgi:tetratricopeptide (TPR) repeat protein
VAEGRVEELRRRVEADPGSRLFAQLAEELRRAGQVDEAVAVARAGLENHPGYASAHLTLGRALLDSGDPAGARAELDTAVQGAPDNILANRLLGEALERLGDLEGALERYGLTLQVAPGDPHVEARVQAIQNQLAATTTPGGGRPASGTPEVTKPMPAVPPPAAGRTPLRRAGLPPTVRLPGMAAPRPEEGPPPVTQPPGRTAGSSGGPPVPEGAGAPGHEPPTDGAASRGGPRPRASAPGEVDRETAAGPGPGQGETTQPGAGTPLADIEVREHGQARLSSATLAELYFKQGLLERAVEVYRQVLEEEPENQAARSRLAEIETAVRERGARSARSPEDDRAARRRGLERTIERLEALLAVVRSR